MEKSVGALEIRRNLGKVLRDIHAHGDTYIVERHGEVVAAVVPMQVYEQWKQSRSRFFARLQRAQSHADLTPEEAAALAQEAVASVRSA